MGGGDNFLILWGGPSCYEGGHRAHGGPPSPPTRENPGLWHILTCVTCFGVMLSIGLSLLLLLEKLKTRGD